MKKIGIITIKDDDNYGNRLQNYAVYKILNKYGNAKNIIRTYGGENRTEFRMMLGRHKRYLIKLVKKLKNKSYVYDRVKNFNKFNKNIIDFKKQISSNLDYKKLNEKFDYFTTGSDQVWNPLLFKDMYINMLGFTSNKKKIAVAPSISMDKLSKEQEEMFKENLKEFDNLSCREEQGSELLRNIIGKEVVTLVDPTLMLSSEDWDKVSCKPKFHDDNKKYMLLYFLGDLNEEYKNIVNEIKAKNNLEIINILDKKSKYYSCGPSEFLYMIKNASFVLTDSFHGSVFSYIYNKPFRILQRQGDGGYMNSRLINLMNKLNLDNSIYLKSGDSLDNIMNVNYHKEALVKEQQKFNDYLERVFNK